MRTSGKVQFSHPRLLASFPSPSPCKFPIPVSLQVSHPRLLAGLPDQGYEESDTSSVFSTPSPKTKIHGLTALLSNETQHASLKRKKLPEKREPAVERQQTLEKSQSLQAELALHRPLSLVLGSHSEANVIMNPTTGSLHRQVGIGHYFMRVVIISLYVLFRCKRRD